jgi:antitoxin ParD1/3/4
MTTITFSLPEAMKEFIDERVASGEYGTVSEYVRALVRSEQIRNGLTTG